MAPVVSLAGERDATGVVDVRCPSIGVASSFLPRVVAQVLLRPRLSWVPGVGSTAANLGQPTDKEELESRVRLPRWLTHRELSVCESARIARRSRWLNPNSCTISRGRSRKRRATTGGDTVLTMQSSGLMSVSAFWELPRTCARARTVSTVVVGRWARERLAIARHELLHQRRTLLSSPVETVIWACGWDTLFSATLITLLWSRQDLQRKRYRVEYNLHPALFALWVSNRWTFLVFCLRLSAVARILKCIVVSVEASILTSFWW